MPIFDFSPLFWWGLPLAAAPLAIHLINLLRQRRVRWAAMEFLLASQRKYRTRVLLRQILLLSLRTLAVFGLVAALAQPRWRPGGLLGGGAAAIHVVVLDDSASMADTTGGDVDPVTDAASGDTRPRTAFDRGRAVVERIAGELVSSGSPQRLGMALTSRLAAAEAAGWLVAPVDVSPDGVQTLRDAIARPGASDAAAGIREAAASIPALVTAAGDGPRVLWVVSDLRAHDWLGDEPAATLRRMAGEGVEIRIVDASVEGPAGNLGIERLRVIGGVPAANVLVPVEVEVRNDAATPARDVVIGLRENGGGRPGVRIDEIPAGGTVARRFDVRFPVAGSQTLEAELPGDVLAADDVRRAVVDVTDRVDVLLIDGGLAKNAAAATGDAFYVATALAPGAAAATGLRPRVDPPATLASTDLTRFGSLWLLDVERLDPAAVAALETYVREGGGAVFFCGPRTDAEAFNRSLHRGGDGLFPVPLAGAVDLLPDPQAAAVPDLSADDHPVVAMLSGQRNPLVDAVRVERFWAIERDFDPAAQGVRRLLSLRTGQPLAVEKSYGAGTVVAMLTTAAPEWNTWARANPSWVVMLLELQNHLGASGRSAEAKLVGQPLALRLDAGSDEPTVDFLVPPDGVIVRQSAGVVAGTVLEARLSDTARAGLYEARWRRLDGTEGQRSFAVNVDPREGRLERLGRGRLESVLRGVPFRYDPADVVVSAAGDLAGRSLVIPLLATVVGLLLAEQLVAYAAGYHPVDRRPTA